MGIYNVNISIKPTLAVIEKDRNFSLSYILCLNIFLNFTPFNFIGLVTYYFIHR